MRRHRSRHQHELQLSDRPSSATPRDRPVHDVADVLGRLATSAFRRRFRLGEDERGYLEDKGLESVLAHGREFIARRLAPPIPDNDGKQTPFRGHPVFIAQHATATCCRGCLAKWHAIPRGRALTSAEQAYVLAVIEAWLRRSAPDAGEDPGAGLDL